MPASSPTRTAPLRQHLAAAAQAVAAVGRGQSLTDALARTPPPLRAAAQALAFATLRQWGTVRALRAQLAPRAPAPAVAALLDVALAQVLAARHAPHTLVSEAVAAVRRVSPPAAGFANAVLRRALREAPALLAGAHATPEARWNHPVWWVARLQADWPEAWQTLLAHAQGHPPMVLRINPRRTTLAAYQRLLAEQGIAAAAVVAPAVAAELPVSQADVLFSPAASAWPAAPQALVLATPCPVQALPGWEAGWVSVQDVAAQWAAPLLLGRAGLPPGARVLDACAAPGGKTAHLLELDDVDLLALDVDAARLARVDANLARLGLAARTQVADAAQPATWWDGQPFDAILLDAPCSASGISRRHPDARWLRREADIPALARTQAALLDALWPLLAPGGALLYATCSVFRAEGQAQIDAFVQRQRAAPPLLDAAAPGHCNPLADNDPDGFFYARLCKPPAPPSPPNLPSHPP